MHARQLRSSIGRVIGRSLLIAFVLFLSGPVLAQAPQIYPKLGYSASSSELSNVLTFSGDGSLLAASSAGNITIWDVDSGRELQTLTGHAGPVSGLAFLPDRRRLVSGSDDRTVRLWDIGSGALLRTFTGHQERVRSIALSSDGAVLASMDKDTVRIWDVGTGQLISTLAPPALEGRTSANLPPLKSIAFAPDNTRIAFTDFRGTVFVAGVRERRVIAAISADKLSSYGALDILGFTRDGKLILGGNKDLIVVDLERQAASDRRRLTGEAVLHSEFVSPDGTLVVGKTLERIHVFDANLNSRVSIAPEGNVASTGYSAARRQIAVGGYGDRLKLYDLDTGRELQDFSNAALDPRGGRFSQDGGTVSVSISGTPARPGQTADQWIKVWNLKTAALEKDYNNTERNRKLLAALESGTIAEREQASRLVAEMNRERVEKESRSEYDELNRCFYLVNTDFRSEQVTIFRIDAKDRNDLMVLFASNSRNWKPLRQFKAHNQTVTALAVSYRHGLIATGSDDKTINLFGYPGTNLIRSFKGHIDKITDLTFSPDGTRLLSESADRTTRLWDVASGRELARFISFADGEWIVITPEGYYNASANGDRHLNVRVGNTIYGIENYRESFFRADLVKLALSGQSLSQFARLDQVRPAPRVEIVGLPGDTNSAEVKVTLRLSDGGGGIGDVRLFLNGSAVMQEAARSLSVQAAPAAGSERSYTVRLVNGRNELRAVAFNGANSMQSNPATAVIAANLGAAARPSLHAIVVGIQEFRNTRLNLKYPVADATLFSDTLKKQAAPLFERVEVTLLTTPAQTSRDAITRAAADVLKRVGPEDLFVFFVASHGTADEGEFFLITSNVGSISTDRLRADALSQSDLRQIMANVPATKKLVVIDTCNAGALGDVLQAAFLTRGMSDATAMKVLSRAVGSTVLSASTSTQEAVEGYRGHGLFTYVIAEGLAGKADVDRDGFVSTLELAKYVDERVPELAEEVFKHTQYPVVSPSGQGFPLAKVR